MKKIVCILLLLGLVSLAICARPAMATTYEATQNWALIVAGTTGPDDGCRRQEDLQTAEAYETLLERSYLPDHIYYVHWNTSRPGVDNTTSKETVKFAITSWIKERSDDNDVIFMYFLDHGWKQFGELWFFGVGGRDFDNSILHFEFGDWLSVLTYGKLFFVIEACFCGMVIPWVSGPNRIIVSSTDENTFSHNDMENPPYLPIFSHKFFQCLAQKNSVGKAFNAAYWAVMNSSWHQYPLLDDDGDGVGHQGPIPNGGDGDLALSVAWLPGDLNEDGKVDMRDIATVARAYGSKPGDPNWNPRADLNGDGFINMTDVNMASNNFGYPT